MFVQHEPQETIFQLFGWCASGCPKRYSKRSPKDTKKAISGTFMGSSPNNPWIPVEAWEQCVPHLSKAPSEPQELEILGSMYMTYCVKFNYTRKDRSLVKDVTPFQSIFKKKTCYCPSCFSHPLPQPEAPPKTRKSSGHLHISGGAAALSATSSIPHSAALQPVFTEQWDVPEKAEEQGKKNPKNLISSCCRGSEAWRRDAPDANPAVLGK